MLNKVLAFIRKNNLIETGDSVVCAVSGGADSVALLFAMYLLREKLGITLTAAHFNHNLRGAESDEDEAFVRSLCDRLDVPLSLGNAHVKTGEKGLEAAARDARYAFFATLSGKIATAHTADDNAETVLLHLIRGTGLKGLGAIAPVRGNIIRPMLGVTRQEVEAFLEEYHLQHRQDSSNDTDDFLRNRVRHHVMPLLKQENPRICENLSAMAQRLRLDEQALQEMAQVDDEPAVSALREMMPAVRSRALENFLKKSGVKEPESEHISLAEALLFSDKPGARADLPGGVTICRRYDHLTVANGKEELPETRLNCPGETTVGLYRFTCVRAADAIHTKTEFTIPEGDWVIRSRRQGDEIRLSGGTKSLKKLLIDRKIPADLRCHIPIIADKDGVAAVCGVAIDERIRFAPPVWRVTVEKIDK